MSGDIDVLHAEFSVEKFGDYIRRGGVVLKVGKTCGVLAVRFVKIHHVPALNDVESVLITRVACVETHQGQSNSSGNQ